MRFDDSLSTVLSADMSPGFGAAATWRQLVDLLGRGRATVEEPLISRLRMLRQAVPLDVRTASARALAFATPDAALVGFFAEDELSVAAPVLRTAQLPADDWLALLPRLTPPLRAVLRHRRDLPPEVVRALESFGSVDFVLPAASDRSAEGESDAAPMAPFLLQFATPDNPSETPFVMFGEAARAVSGAAEALRQFDEPPPAPTEPAGYAISDLVARIEAFNRGQIETADVAPAAEPASSFRFETDARGVIRWVDGVARAALVGFSLASAAMQGLAQADAAVAGAFRRRSRFTDARLELDGQSDAAGSWRVSGMPQFEPDSGRFIGYHGTARRPRRDEAAEPRATGQRADTDSLRQLVHELRTPTNAIAGFAELIESELLGPVSPTYRARAGTIRAHAADLIAAIEDLDTAARIDGKALHLRPTSVMPGPLLSRVAADVQPLAAIRGATLAVDTSGAKQAIAGDEIAVERLVGRLVAALLSTSQAGERISVTAVDVEGRVAIAMDRPAGLVATGDEGDPLNSLEAGEGIDGVPGMPLLGTGFALRLARNLAPELGGCLTIETDCLTLQLPAVLDRTVEQATTL